MTGDGADGVDGVPDPPQSSAAVTEVVVPQGRLVAFLGLAWVLMWTVNGFNAETGDGRLAWWVGAAVMAVVVIVGFLRQPKTLVIDGDGIGWTGRRPSRWRWDEVQRLERRGLADLQLHLKSGKTERLLLGDAKLPGQDGEAVGDLVVERATAAGVELGRVVSPRVLRRMQHNVPIHASESN